MIEGCDWVVLYMGRQHSNVLMLLAIELIFNSRGFINRSRTSKIDSSACIFVGPVVMGLCMKLPDLFLHFSVEGFYRKLQVHVS